VSGAAVNKFSHRATGLPGGNPEPDRVVVCDGLKVAACIKSKAASKRAYGNRSVFGSATIHSAPPRRWVKASMPSKAASPLRRCGTYRPGRRELSCMITQHALAASQI
jgi:hypothetical protein